MNKKKSILSLIKELFSESAEEEKPNESDPIKSEPIDNESAESDSIENEPAYNEFAESDSTDNESAESEPEPQDGPVRMLGDLRLCETLKISNVFGFGEEAILKITEEFFSDDAILSIDGGALTSEEKDCAVRQIIAYGQQWNYGSGNNHSEGFTCEPGKLSHTYDIYSYETICLDGGSYTPDIREVTHSLVFRYKPGENWDHIIALCGMEEKKWQPPQLPPPYHYRDQRESWGFNGSLKDENIEVRIVEHTLYLKDPFGMKGIFSFSRW